MKYKKQTARSDTNGIEKLIIILIFFLLINNLSEKSKNKRNAEKSKIATILVINAIDKSNPA